MLRLSHNLLVAGLLSLGAGAAAQPPGPPPPGPGALTQHRPLDRPNMRAPAPRPPAQNRPATRSALKTALETRFDTMDVNRDGMLDAKDREARRGERVAAAFARIDENGDGAISKDEFAAAPALAAGSRPMARRAMVFAPRRPGGPQDATGRSITKSDFVARGLARFDEVDTDHDGTLSAAERDAARGSMRDRRERAKLPASRPNPQPSGQ